MRKDDRPWAPETEEESKKEDRLRHRRMNRMLPKRLSWENFMNGVWRGKQRLLHVVPPKLLPGRIRRVMTKLERGQKGFPTPTLASSFHMHTIRLTVIGALLAAVRKHSDDGLRTFTLMNEKWEFTPQELDEISAAVIKNRLRSQSMNGLGIRNSIQRRFYLSLLLASQ